MVVNLAKSYEHLALLHSLNSNVKLNSSRENTHEHLQRTNSIDYVSEFGFRINEQGFFTKDLNKIAHLPYSYDINIQSIRHIARQWIKQSDELMDLPYMLNIYYNYLRALNPEFSNDGSSYLSRDSIFKFVQGFSTQEGKLEGKIEQSYKDQNQLNNALEQVKILNTLMLDNKIINYHFDKALNNTSSNPILKPYLNENFQVSKTGLLMNFIYHDIKNQNELNFFTKGLNLDLQAHKNLYKILNGQQSMEDFIRQNNEKKMSFDLYLYVNGIDKKKSSKDKLLVFFQQYNNYQKHMEVKEFVNSSSIYQIYMDMIIRDFEKIKQNYENENKERLEQINQDRESTLEHFLRQRQKQASLNKILKAYISAMI